MSSRVLKKLHGDNDLDIGDHDISDIDTDIGGGGARKKQFEVNRYDLVSILCEKEHELLSSNSAYNDPQWSFSLEKKNLIILFVDSFSNHYPKVK